MAKFSFSEGLPKRPTFAESAPNEYLTKTCGECVRFNGEFCPINLSPRNRSAPACKDFWDKAAQEKLQRQQDEDEEKRREELWAIYAEKPPVKLPLIHDGYGIIPECPICGEMPYSTVQCHWCGQRFIQDEDIQKYNEPNPEVRMNCIMCGGKNTMVGTRDKYNNHFHGHCEKCGAVMME